MLTASEVQTKLAQTEKLRKPDLFQKLLHEYPIGVTREIHKTLVHEEYYHENIYKSIQELYRLFTEKISAQSNESLRLKLEQEGPEILKCFEILLRRDEVGVPIVNEERLLLMFVNSELQSLQPFFVTKKFQLQQKCLSEINTIIFLKTVWASFDYFGFLLNNAGNFHTWNPLNEPAIINLVDKIQTVKASEYLWINIVPFFVRNSRPANSGIFLPFIRKIIESLTLKNNGRPVDISQFISDSIYFIEDYRNTAAVANIYEILCHFDNCEDRTRALIFYLMFLGLLQNGETATDIMYFYRKEFGEDAFLLTFLSYDKTQFVKYLESTPAWPSIASVISGENIRLSKDFATNLVLHRLLDVSNEYSFDTPAASHLKFQMFQKRVFKSMMCQVTLGLTFGEYLALKEANKMILPAGFITNTNFEKYSKDDESSEFDAKMSYLVGVREYERVEAETSAQDHVALRQAKSKFLKAQLFKNSSIKKLNVISKKQFSAEKETMEELESPVVSGFGTFVDSTSEYVDKLFEEEHTAEEFDNLIVAFIEKHKNEPKVKREIFNSFIFSSELKNKVSEIVKQESDELISKNVNRFFFGNQQPPKQSLSLSINSKLGLLTLDLNCYGVNRLVEPFLNKDEYQWYLFHLKSGLTKTQFYVLLNIYMSQSQKPTSKISGVFIEVCRDKRWPKALIEMMYLQIRCDFLVDTSFNYGIQVLSQFRYMNVEAIDLALLYFSRNRSYSLVFKMLAPVFESMIVHEQTSEFYSRFEDIKGFLQSCHYKENEALDSQKNEALEKVFKEKLEEMRVELHSVVFDLTVKYRLTVRSNLLFSEMIGLKYFKNIGDAMNMLRFSRFAQKNLDATLVYLRTDLNVMNDSNLCFPNPFADELLDILYEAGVSMNRYMIPMLQLLFGKNKLQVTEEHLLSVLKIVLVNGNYAALNYFLESVARLRVSTRQGFQADTKEFCLSVCSRCNSEDLRGAIIDKIEHIFELNQNAVKKKNVDEEKLSKIAEKEKQEFFKLIWESRLEKFELKFLIHNSKPHPKKRPTKDKRSFMLKTMEDMHVLELKRLGEKKEKREEEEKATEDKTKEVKKESMENKRTDF